MYKKVLTDLKFGERELEVLDFWHKNKIFEQSMKENEDGPKFTFYDGPPTANGKPHIGHIPISYTHLQMAEAERDCGGRGNGRAGRLPCRCRLTLRAGLLFLQAHAQPGV